MSLQSKADFVKILEENKGIIYKIARSYCKDSDDQQDIIQEISLALWKSFDRFDGTVKFTTWMYRVALNVAISCYRKDSKRKATLAPLSLDIIHSMPDHQDEESEKRLTLLEGFIKGLNDLDRALMLLYLEEKKQTEIAEILGLSVANVSTKVGRVKEKLKKQFSNQ